MLRSIKLDYDHGGWYKEIDNETMKLFLPVYAEWQSFQKIIPQMLFLFRHIVTQSSCRLLKIVHRWILCLPIVHISIPHIGF